MEPGEQVPRWRQRLGLDMVICLCEDGSRDGVEGAPFTLDGSMLVWREQRM
jgi:hypothetical protein